MKLSFKFLQTGGVPLTNDLMALLEESYGIFEVLGTLAGNLTILAGCDPVVAGSATINPGIVVIDGKLYYFEGGLASNTVFIHTEEIQKVFQNQIPTTLIEKRTVRFGNSIAPNLYNWADFVSLKTLKDMQDFATQAQITALNNRIKILELKTAPIINGGIVWAWNKPANEIPDGWKECVDLRGKTIVGLDPNDALFSTLGTNVGSKTHKLTNSELPILEGKFQTISQTINNGSGILSVEYASAATIAGGNSTFSHKGMKINLGGNQPHNNVQPSRIVLFIEPNFQ